LKNLDPAPLTAFFSARGGGSIEPPTIPWRDQHVNVSRAVVCPWHSNHAFVQGYDSPVLATRANWQSSTWACSNALERKRKLPGQGVIPASCVVLYECRLHRHASRATSTTMRPLLSAALVSTLAPKNETPFPQPQPLSCVVRCSQRTAANLPRKPNVFANADAHAAKRGPNEDLTTSARRSARQPPKPIPTSVVVFPSSVCTAQPDPTWEVAAVVPQTEPPVSLAIARGDSVQARRVLGRN